MCYFLKYTATALHGTFCVVRPDAGKRTLGFVDFALTPTAKRKGSAIWNAVHEAAQKRDFPPLHSSVNGP